MSGVQSWTSGVIRVGEVDLAWEQMGPAEGEPVVLVMGLGWQTLHWPEALCTDLAARGFRVVRFDNRDAGLSGSVSRGVRAPILLDDLRVKLGQGRRLRANYTLHDMADDLRGLLDALGLSRVHLVGFSMGGMIAQLLAARHPGRVLSLTTYASSSNHPWLPLPKLRVLRNLLAPLPNPATREAMVPRMVLHIEGLAGSRFHTPRHERQALCERAFDRAFRPAGVARQMHAIVVTGSLEGELSEVRAPTQVVHGLEDPLLHPAGSRRIAKGIRGARLELIEGLGHEMPPGFLPHLAELIATNAGRA